MQGTIVKILVEVGDSIKAGDAVFLLEAMKMENSLAAERSGSVAEIRVSKGDSVGAGDVPNILEIQNGYQTKKATLIKQAG